MQPTHARARRALARHEAQVAHELARVLEPAQVADLGHDGHGADQPDAAQRLQCLHHGSERPSGQELGDRGLDPLQPLLRVPDGEQHFLQHQPVRGVLEALPL